ncbi:MAG TPA: hypothetical protein VGA13_07490 [Acidimicrobiales bacterium]
MHPVEVIRWVLRSPGARSDEIVDEVAYALASLPERDRVLAARRLVAHRPSDAVLWWLCAHLLPTDTPLAAADRCLALLDGDETADEVAGLLGSEAAVASVGERDVALRVFELRPDLTWAEDPSMAASVIVEPIAATADGVLLRSAGWPTAADLGGPSVILVAIPVGRALPAGARRALGVADGLVELGWDELGDVRIVGPLGPIDGAPGPAVVRMIDCPPAPELSAVHQA